MKKIVEISLYPFFKYVAKKMEVSERSFMKRLGYNTPEAFKLRLKSFDGEILKNLKKSIQIDIKFNVLQDKKKIVVQVDNIYDLFSVYCLENNIYLSKLIEISGGDKKKFYCHSSKIDPLSHIDLETRMRIEKTTEGFITVKDWSN